MKSQQLFDSYFPGIYIRCMLEDRDRTYTMEEIERETGFDRRTIAYYVQEGLLPKVGRRGPRTRYPRHYLDRLLFIKKIRDLQDRGQLGNYTLEDIREIFDTVPGRMIADIVSGKEPLEVAPYGRTTRGRPLASLGSPRERIERLRRLSGVRSSRDDADASSRSPRRGSPWLIDPMKPPPSAPERRSSPEKQAEANGGLDPDRDSPETAAAMGDDEDALFLDLDTPQRELMVRRVVEDVAAPQAVSPILERRATPPPSTLARMLAQLDEAAGRQSRGGVAEGWTRAEVTPDLVMTVRGLDEDNAELLERIARVLRAMIGAQRRR